MSFYEDRMSEDDLLVTITQTATVGGWSWWHFSDSRREVRQGVFVGDKDAAGWPDLVLVRPGRLLLLELKTMKGRVRPSQKSAMERLIAADVDVRVVRPCDLPELERELLSGIGG